MALSVNTVFELRTDGSDDNGGGFVEGASGTDWSQQAAAQYSVTDGVTNGTTTITSATANFGTDVVGNILHISGGTGGITDGWYEIVSRTNSSTIVVDRSTGLTTGTGSTIVIGGALASPGGLGRVVATAANNPAFRVWIKSGTYTMTSSSNNVPGGRLLLSNYAGNPFIDGYETVRGDLGTPPVIHAGAITGGTMISISLAAGGTAGYVNNLEIDGNNNASISGISYTNNGCLSYITVKNCPVVGIQTSAFPAQYCYVENCGTGCNSIIYNSWLNGCTIGVSGSAVHCLITGGTYGAFIGFTSRYFNCTVYGTSSHGIYTNNAMRGASVRNCVVVNAGGYAYQSNQTSRTGGLFKNNYFYNCTSGGIQGSSVWAHYEAPTELTADPFVDAANDDFSLNSVSGGGQILRGSGLSMPLQNDYKDVGGLQHLDSGGGGFAKPHHPFLQQVIA